MPSISAIDLTYSPPGSEAVFEHLQLSLGPGRYGLTGPNGGGKSTLIRLVAGRLQPTAGHIKTRGRLGYLPQRLDFGQQSTLGQLLGVDRILTALEAISRGSIDPADFDAVGDDWDIAERVQAQLALIGLGHLTMDREVAGLSGGERVLAAFAGVMLTEPRILLLDEPTNNLDAAAKGQLIQAIESFKGLVLVVTHERGLLDRLDRIGELRDGHLSWYPAPFAAFQEQKDRQRAAAERDIREARAELRREQQDLAEAQTKQARRDRQGRLAGQSIPKIMADRRRNAAELASGRSKHLHEGKVDQAKAQLDGARGQLERRIQFAPVLPGAAVPTGRTVLEVDAARLPFTNAEVSFTIRGPERIAIAGPNGAGKTTLFRVILGQEKLAAGRVELKVPARLLPQGLAQPRPAAGGPRPLLDPDRSALDNVLATGADPRQARYQLGRLGLGGAKALRPAGVLSGGERWRAALAALLLAQPTPQLLLLDEPTNDLDLDSVEVLESALATYPGAVLVVSHDQAFLDAIKATATYPIHPQRAPDHGR